MFTHPSIEIIVALTTVILMVACDSSTTSSSIVVASFSPPVVVVESPHQAMSNAFFMKTSRHSFENILLPKNVNRKRSLLLYNQKKNAEDEDNNASSTTPADNKTKKRTTSKQLPVIPVLGPFINTPPLMLGREMSLDPPTPLQWKALQESIVEHFNHQKSLDGDKSCQKVCDDDIIRYTATIDASPLIAIIDKVTGGSASNYGKGRYATLAAVVGIKTHNKRTKNGNEDIKNGNEMMNDDEEQVIEESFLDYYTDQVCSVLDEEPSFILPTSSCVRLVGVGRALLKRFFYRVPSDLCSDNHDDINYGMDDDSDDDHTSFTSFDDILNHGYEDNTPIIMAEFEPLVDDISICSGADPDKIGDKHQPSYRMSPVHALSELNNAVLKVSRMHDYRRRLVSGIHTAKARLNMFDENLQDLDGLGLLFENKNILETGNPESGLFSDDNMKMVHQSITKKELDVLQSMENYGMGYYEAFSSMEDLTKKLSFVLEPYYSKNFKDRDEYKMEISSFVAFQCISEYVTQSDMAWSLQCTSTIERLNGAYTIMFHHALQLKKLAEQLNQELDKYGEECTDLW